MFFIRSLWSYTANQLNITTRQHFSINELHYNIQRRFTDFTEFIDKLPAKSHEWNVVEDIDLPHVQELFEKGADGNGYSFAHNIVVDYYGFSRTTLRNDKESPEPQTAQ